MTLDTHTAWQDIEDGLPIHILPRGDGHHVACYHVPPQRRDIPGITHLGGLGSTIHSYKPRQLMVHCRDNGIGFTYVEYFGHGYSTGTQSEGNIGLWLGDSLTAFDAFASGKQIVVGTCLGGWIGLHLAAQRPEQVVGLVGLAAAPDLFDNIIWFSQSDSEREDSHERGYAVYPATDSPTDLHKYPISMIEKSRPYNILNDKIHLSCPVRLIQGGADRFMPADYVDTIADNIISPDTRVVMLPDSGHFLKQQDDFAAILMIIEDLQTRATTPTAKTAHRQTIDAKPF